MIPKISPINLNFKGQVKIGSCEQEKTAIAKKIERLPEYTRGEFARALNVVKNAIEIHTPNGKKFNYTIHVLEDEDKDEKTRGLRITVAKDMYADKAQYSKTQRMLSEESRYIPTAIVGERKLHDYEISENMKSAFYDLANNTIGSAESLIYPDVCAHYTTYPEILEILDKK